MFGSTFGIVAQGLEIFRKSVDIRNRNILNASNPDYVQEDPVVVSFAPVGIRLEEVLRTQNFYYMITRNQKLSLISSLETTIRGNSQVESLFQEFIQGLGGSEYINRFFTAYQNLMKEPTNEGAKGELLNSAQSLISYLKDRRMDMDRMLAGTDYEMNQHLARINNLSKKIARINEDILLGYAQTYTRGRDYKNLLDERDKYLRELSELISVRVQEDEIGRVRVETDRGFVLVEAQYSWELKYNAGSRRVLWKSRNGHEVDISGFISGGKVKGLLDFQSHLREYTNRLEGIAQKLISEVKLPLNSQATNNWHWFRHVEDPNGPLGFSGSITFNFPGGPVTLNYTSTSTINSLVNAINTDPVLNAMGFNASILANPDNSYTMVISSPNPSYTIEDSNHLIYRSEALFVGRGIQDMALNSNANAYLQNLEYERVDEFMNFSRSWWEGVKSLYNAFINETASIQKNLKTRQEIESALLNSLNARIQEMQGVSVDNEFIELMKLQRSYEALARAINALDEMIQVTLNMV
ncbi:MAG: flagellar hook-associated protein FlgK [Aquificaceae bacterium]|nr:flagellar hook-associated protein FlgK [Aquificaceae bacterium]